jgi:hypothetical protein
LGLVALHDLALLGVEGVADRETHRLLHGMPQGVGDGRLLGRHHVVSDDRGLTAGLDGTPAGSVRGNSRKPAQQCK